MEGAYGGENNVRRTRPKWDFPKREREREREREKETGIRQREGERKSERRWARSDEESLSTKNLGFLL